MRAALYIRVSTETDEQVQSVEEQERGGRAWCQRNGHEVVQVLRDVGHSGAEFKLRPGVLELQRLAKLTPRPFDLVVTRDADRLGRDAFRLPLLISDLGERGVKVVAWSTGEVLEVAGATAKLMLSVKAGLAEVQRETIAHVTRTALRTRAERGLVAGGRVYGYDGIRGPEGVRYAVNPREAEVVREIYRRRAAGESGRAIACDLNRRGVASPHAGARGSGSWCSSQVRFIAMNPRYRGEATYGRATSVYVGGTAKRVSRDDAVTYAVPAIVTPEEWAAAQHNTARGASGTARTVHRGRPVRYLLVGMSVCGVCGGRLATTRTSSGVGDGRTSLVGYMCGNARDRGTCDRRWRRPVDRIDRPVLDWLINSVLSPDVVGEAIEDQRARLLAEAPGPDPRAVEMRARADDLERRVGRLLRQVEEDDDEGTRAALRERRRELADVRRALADLERTVTVATPADAARLVERVEALRPAVEAAREERPDLVRAVLAAVLAGPVRVTPTGDGRAPLRVEAEASPGALLGLSLPGLDAGSAGSAGSASDPTPSGAPQFSNTYFPNRMVMSPAGVEPAPGGAPAQSGDGNPGDFVDLATPRDLSGRVGGGAGGGDRARAMIRAALDAALDEGNGEMAAALVALLGKGKPPTAPAAAGGQVVPIGSARRKPR